MSYRATVLTVMIASPFDVGDERDAVEEAIHDWNVSNAGNKRVVLLPWRWEKNSVPQLGGHPQALINAQGVDQSDVVVAMFAGRLGKATPEAISGTAEEVTRAQEAGKPVHLYFSSGSIPANTDPDQLAALNNFKKQMETAGLYGSFKDPADLAAQVRRALDYDVANVQAVESENAAAEVSPAIKSVDFTAQPGCRMGSPLVGNRSGRRTIGLTSRMLGTPMRTTSTMRRWGSAARWSSSPRRPASSRKGRRDEFPTC